MLQLRMIERSRADGPVVVSREALELLRALALRLLRALEPVNDRSAYFDARLFDDSISSLDVVAWLVADAGNDASSAQDAHWVGQALVAHGFLRRAARRGRDACAARAAMHAESVAASRLRRRFERARDARYRVDRLRVCDHRARVSVRGARHLRNIHLLKRGGAAYVRAVVGGAVAFETTVDGGAAFPDASWDEAYEVGCNLGERVELRVVDRDGGLLGGTNLGDLDLGLVDDHVAAAAPARGGGAPPLACARLAPGGRALAVKLGRDAGAGERYLPLTSATGGHGSDSATLCAHVAVFPRGDDGGGAARGAPPPGVARFGAWEWDGPREWLVRASVIRCADVRYDLAETWGLAWALRPRLVAGDAEACGGLADKDLGVAGAAWASQGGDGDLTVAATLNRAGGHASLVLGERARSDLIERRVAVAVLPLDGLPVRDGGAPPPPPRWIHLERPASRGAASLRGANGAVLASVWLERPRGAAPEREASAAAKRRDAAALAADARRRNAARGRRAAAAAAAAVVGGRALGVGGGGGGAAAAAAGLAALAARAALAAARRAPALVASGAAAALVAAAAGPLLLGALFSWLVTRVVVARRDARAPAPRVEAGAIAVHCWVGASRRPAAAAARRDRGAASTLLRDVAGPAVAGWYDALALALHVDITVRDFRFGNPPGFERDHLLDVRAAAFCVETQPLVRGVPAKLQSSPTRSIRSRFG